MDHPAASAGTLREPRLDRIYEVARRRRLPPRPPARRNLVTVIGGVPSSSDRDPLNSGMNDHGSRAVLQLTLSDRQHSDDRVVLERVLPQNLVHLPQFVHRDSTRSRTTSRSMSESGWASPLAQEPKRSTVRRRLPYRCAGAPPRPRARSLPHRRPPRARAGLCPAAPASPAPQRSGQAARRQPATGAASPLTEIAQNAG